MKMKLSIFKITFVFGTLVVSGILAWNVDPEAARSDLVITTVVTLFSILAGFLMAIMALTAESEGTHAGNWRELQRRYPVVQTRLYTCAMIFYVYMTTMGLIVASDLIRNFHPATASTIDFLYIWFGFWSFMLSFSIPVILSKTLLGWFDQRIRTKRKDVGLTD